MSIHQVPYYFIFSKFGGRLEITGRVLYNNVRNICSKTRGIPNMYDILTSMWKNPGSTFSPLPFWFWNDKLDKDELISMLIENSDEPYAKQIAQTVMKWQKKGKPIATTTDMRRCIEEALSFLPKNEQKEAVKKSCQRTFQALRIDVNSEFEVLYAFLDKLPHILNPGGRVAILTFHSGEDRLVKRIFKEMKSEGIYADVSKDVIRPTPEECARNPRAASTKMRWAVKS